MLDKKLTDTTTVSSVASTDKMYINQGNATRQVAVQKAIDLAKEAAMVAARAELNPSIMDGVYIMYHRKSDNYPVVAFPDGWTALQNSGEVADGVLVVQGCKHIVVAPTDSGIGLFWSSAAVTVGATIADRVLAMNDWTGKARTAAILANATIGGDGAGYAPGFCAAYSRVNANGFGLTAGKWWLPSVGELFIIFANQKKINYCLSLITGATQLNTAPHWSSTEYSATYAWYLNLGNGLLHGGYGKVTSRVWARAVSAFIS